MRFMQKAGAVFLLVAAGGSSKKWEEVKIPEASREIVYTYRSIIPDQLRSMLCSNWAKGQGFSNQDIAKRFATILLWPVDTFYSNNFLKKTGLQKYPGGYYLEANIASLKRNEARLPKRLIHWALAVTLPRKVSEKGFFKIRDSLKETLKASLLERKQVLQEIKIEFPENYSELLSDFQNPFLLPETKRVFWVFRGQQYFFQRSGTELGFGKVYEEKEKTEHSIKTRPFQSWRKKDLSNAAKWFLDKELVFDRCKDLKHICFDAENDLMRTIIGILNSSDTRAYLRGLSQKIRSIDELARADFGFLLRNPDYFQRAAQRVVRRQADADYVASSRTTTLGNPRTRLLAQQKGNQ